MSDSKPVISVIVPAFNEKQSISFVLQELKKTLASLCLPFELLVVDDGSTDNTGQLATEQGVKVIRHNVNQGKGASIVAGISSTHGPILLTFDADGSNSPADIQMLLRPVLEGDADIVVGTRFTGFLERSQHPSIFRSVGNFLLNLLFLAVSGIPIQDSQSGFRAYKRTVFQGMNTERTGYEWETEILLKTLGRGMKVKQVPIIYRERIGGVSHLKILRDAPRIVVAMIKYRTRWTRKQG